MSESTVNPSPSTDLQQTLESLDKPALLELFSGFVQGYPGGPAQLRAMLIERGLLAPEEPRLVPEIEGPLGQLASIANGYFEQAQLDAASVIYCEITERLSAGDALVEDLERGPDELIERFVFGLASTLGECFGDEPSCNPRRPQIINALWGLWSFDMETGGLGSQERIEELLLSVASEEERDQLAERVRSGIEALEASTLDSDQILYRREMFGRFLLDLEGEELEVESYLALCRKTGQMGELIGMLLGNRRAEEAYRTALRVDIKRIPHVANLFLADGHECYGETLVRKRLEGAEHEEQARPLREWMLDFLLEHHRLEEAVGFAQQELQAQPSLRSYQELRHIALQIKRWQDTEPEAIRTLLAAHPHKAIDLLLAHVEGLLGSQHSPDHLEARRTLELLREHLGDQPPEHIAKLLENLHETIVELLERPKSMAARRPMI